MSVVCLKTYRDARVITDILGPRGLTEEFCEKMSQVSDDAVAELKEILSPERPKRAKGVPKPKQRISGLDWYPRLKVWKGCNGKAKLDPETLESRSYGWWLITKRIGNHLIFNNYRYSNTTSGHQFCVRGWLDQHGFSFETIEAPGGLQDLDSAIREYEHQADVLAKEIAKPRSRPEKNRERQAKIMAIRAKLRLVAKLQRAERRAERGSA